LSGFIRPYWQVYPTNPQRSRQHIPRAQPRAGSGAPADAAPDRCQLPSRGAARAPEPAAGRYPQRPPRRNAPAASAGRNTRPRRYATGNGRAGSTTASPAIFPRLNGVPVARHQCIPRTLSVARPAGSGCAGAVRMNDRKFRLPRSSTATPRLACILRGSANTERGVLSGVRGNRRGHGSKEEASDGTERKISSAR
jgi:hypothetical protein